MRLTLAVLALLSLLAVSCAAAGPASLSTNPNLTAAQRDDLEMLAMFSHQQGFNLNPDLTDLDGNGQLDPKTGTAIQFGSAQIGGCPRFLSPDQDLAAIADFNGNAMAGCGYEIDKLVVRAGPDSWTATFATAVGCGSLLGDSPKDQCTTDKVWQKGTGKGKEG